MMRLVQDLHVDADPSGLAGRVDIEALIEYYVRVAVAICVPAVEAALSRFHEQGRAHFVNQVLRMRQDGLPQRLVVGEPNAPPSSWLVRLARRAGVTEGGASHGTKGDSSADETIRRSRARRPDRYPVVRGTLPRAFYARPISRRYDLNLWIGDSFGGATYLPR
jgi:hypothetical protein